ncbi:hypothetical protein ELQ90_01405 [Labedella phragmitis]|uniref:Uncharacterized protein n=1 Tax=Labedella phragmitis TaxID=2498849 RepID=A0A444PXN7_9MICO|nr:hypothetical protein [Labedella phragmitis]RWZ52635.1 hypothetical protein ELQ90_01405 [Labedella phragmitis]
MGEIILTAALVVLIIVGLVFVAVVLVRPLIGRRPDDDGHDDQLRAGTDPGTDIGTATDRATGTTAWMRPGGGGV